MYIVSPRRHQLSLQRANEKSSSPWTCFFPSKLLFKTTLPHFLLLLHKIMFQKPPLLFLDCVLGRIVLAPTSWMSSQPDHSTPLNRLISLRLGRWPIGQWGEILGGFATSIRKARIANLLECKSGGTSDHQRERLPENEINTDECRTERQRWFFNRMFELLGPAITVDTDTCTLDSFISQVKSFLFSCSSQFGLSFCHYTWNPDK